MRAASWLVVGVVAVTGCRKAAGPAGDVERRTIVDKMNPAGGGGAGANGAVCKDGGAAPAGGQVFTAGGEALTPAIAALGDADWIVGWVDAGHVAVATEKNVAAGKAPVLPSTARSSWGIAVATAADRAVAVWVDDDPVRTVKAQLFDAAGAPLGTALTLSTKTDVGRPAVAALADGSGFVVVWVEVPDVRAALIARDGKVGKVDKVAAQTSWPGGNLRPWTQFSGPKPANAPIERAAPLTLGYAPSLLVDKQGVRAFWWGTVWMSDDQAGYGRYERVVTFPDAGGEPALAAADLPVWATLAADAEGMSVQAFHNPNGGAWELALRKAGSAAAATPFTSEPAGPLEPALAAVAAGWIVAWPSPTYGGVALTTVDSAGATSALAALPSGAPTGDSGVAVAARGKTARLAYVACGDQGGTVIRTAAPGDAKAAQVVARTIVETEVLPWSLPKRKSGLEEVDAATAQGNTWLLALASTWSSTSGGAEVLAYPLDAAGVPSGDPTALDAFGPRCDWGTTAAVDGVVLAAYSCCNDSSICSRADVRLATLRAGAKAGGAAKAVILTKADPQHAMPALAVADDRLGLVMVRGEYSSRRVLVRIAARTAGADPAAALAKAKDVEIVPWSGDDVGAPTAAFVPGGLLVAFHDSHAPGRSHPDTELHIVLVTADGKTQDGVALREVGYGTWGEHRMIGVGDGAALLVNEMANGEPQAVLLLLAADGATVTRRTVLARRTAMQAPHLALSADGTTLAAAWYDPRTDGDFVAFAAADGTRRGVPVRVDRPELRASRDQPVVIPGAQAGAWRVFWKEPNSLFTAPVQQQP